MLSLAKSRASQPAAEIIEFPGITHRVLVVDDEEAVLGVLCETLKREGYDVVGAPNGQAALDIVKQTSFSVILTDQRMPKMTGLEFLAQAKTLQPHASRILITALLEMDTVIGAINKGEIYRFLVKPWLREELLVAVKNGSQRYELLCRNAALHANTQAMNEKLGRLNDSLQRQVEREAEQNQQLEKLNQALQQNLQRSVELCFKTMQTFYPMLGTQSRRASELCDSFAESLGLPREDQEILHISALLHDIGLVGISRTLIKQWQRSPKSLSDAERRLIMQHPILGQDLVGFIDNLEAVGTLIRAHHERFDGTGYPDQLAGDAIPRLARLLAVAVSYAESPLSEEETVQAIKRGSGSAFDPEAVRLFLRCHPNAASPRGQRQVLLAELRPGMVLARAIYTANGLLLFPEGQVLTTQYIDKLLNHHRVNPINQSLLVYC